MLRFECMLRTDYFHAIGAKHFRAVTSYEVNLLERG